MLNDVMTLAEASVIWKIEYKALLECIVGDPLRPLHFHSDEYDRIQDTWIVTKQGMERLYGPMPSIDAATALMLVKLQVPFGLVLPITHYAESENEFLFSHSGYGGGPDKVDKHTGIVGAKYERWDTKRDWKETSELDVSRFEFLLDPIIQELRDKQKELANEMEERTKSRGEKSFFRRLLDKLK